MASPRPVLAGVTPDAALSLVDRPVKSAPGVDKAHGPQLELCQILSVGFQRLSCKDLLQVFSPRRQPEQTSYKKR